tara:strand:- start:2394 stop:4286 length:1893 start_codon:yes stop_codon:yes gene_type:complete
LSEHNFQLLSSTLQQLFGDNRAEWPPSSFRQLFVTPTYLSKLEARRPCILVGGRGTGKTTALQSLRYDASYDRLQSNGQDFGDLVYLGFLVRINKNRVRSFHGRDESLDWGKYFAHYFNLIACAELVSMAAWLEEKTGLRMPVASLKLIAQDLGMVDFSGDSTLSLGGAIKNALSLLQLKVNNPKSRQEVVLSMAEAPLRTFVEELVACELAGERTIFCCIDEYENLLDYQQAILNTYVKHASPPLSYKVGVRKNGLRNRQTLDGQDLLRTPDDYYEIEIAEEGFDHFAQQVAAVRIRAARDAGIPIPKNLNVFLEELSFAEEAQLLGAERIAKKVLEELAGEPVCAYFERKPSHEVYFLKYWQASEKTSILDLALHWIANEQEWKTRLGNYGYASLFWLSRGNKGARIRKYYCGTRVFLALAGGNIRYFLELIEASLRHELSDRTDFPNELTLSPKSQTLAAKEVGERKLNQIEGLADHGVQLKRMILAVGKVFFELAREPLGRTPEVTSFVVAGEKDDVEAIGELLNEGVSHLAFDVEPATKLTSHSQIREDEYRLHRIFSAFFEISHRKKRRMTIAAEDLMAVLGDRPSKAISSILEDRPQSHEDELPEQLALFSAFYNGDGVEGVQ